MTSKTKRLLMKAKKTTISKIMVGLFFKVTLHLEHSEEYERFPPEHMDTVMKDLHHEGKTKIKYSSQSRRLDSRTSNTKSQSIYRNDNPDEPGEL